MQNSYINLTTKLGEHLNRQMPAGDFSFMGGLVKRFGIEIVETAVGEFIKLDRKYKYDYMHQYLMAVCKNEVISKKFTPTKKTRIDQIIEEMKRAETEDL